MLSWLLLPATCLIAQSARIFSSIRYFYAKFFFLLEEIQSQNLKKKNTKIRRFFFCFYISILHLFPNSGSLPSSLFIVLTINTHGQYFSSLGKLVLRNEQDNHTQYGVSVRQSFSIAKSDQQSLVLKARCFH